MHMSPRVLIVLSLVVSVLCLGIGVLIGYFVRPTIDSSLLEKDRRACEIGHGSFIPQVQRFVDIYRNCIQN